MRNRRKTIERVKKGREALGQSQRSGAVDKLKNFVREPSTGSWVLRSEVDYTRYVDEFVPITKDELIVSPILPLAPGASEKEIDPNKWGTFGIHFDGPAWPELEYSRHIQHPEQHFWSWYQEEDTVASGIDTDNPRDLGAIGVWEQDFDRVVQIPLRPLQMNEYVVFAVHHSIPNALGDYQFRAWAIGNIDGHIVDQKDLLRRSTDVTLFSELYHTYIGRNMFTRFVFKSENDNFFYLRNVA